MGVEVCVCLCAQEWGGAKGLRVSVHVCLDALSGAIVGVFPDQGCAKREEGRRQDWRVEGKKCEGEKRGGGGGRFIQSFSHPLRDSWIFSCPCVCLSARPDQVPT